MADQFYSSLPLNDENSFYNSNNVSTKLQQQLQQQQQQHLQLASANATTGSNMSNVSVNDYNNNNINNNALARCNAGLRYFGAPGLCTGNGVDSSGSSNYEKMLSYNNSGLAFPGCNYVAGTPGCDLHTSIMHSNNNAMACQYAHANGSASCYNRNRYMPYNHNRTCAAAAAAAVSAVAGQPLVGHLHHHHMNPLGGFGTSTSGYNYQQFAPIYQQSSCGGGGGGGGGNGIGGNGGAILSGPSAPLQSAIVNVGANSSLPHCSTLMSSTAAANISHDFSTYGLGGNNTPATSCSNTSVGTLPTNSLVAAAGGGGSIVSSGASDASAANCSLTLAASNGAFGTTAGSSFTSDSSDAVTLQITNLDYSLDEASLRNFLLNQLKPITPDVSLVFEGSTYAKVTVPDLYFAKQVVSNLHRKKIGHKRMLVSYTRDSSLTEINTLRCQVAGLLKDVPYYTLPMYKFRELFQSRFKTSISVLDLYKMQDICTINSDNNEDKFISLQPDLVNSLESSPLMEGLQHSVPYCTVHFKREQHKGWAEQDIEPLPNVYMTIAEIQQIIYPLLKHHPGDIPVATLVHCIEGELNVQITANDNGVNLEHLVCCVQGIQIQVNNFGIKILELMKEGTPNTSSSASNGNSTCVSAIERSGYAKNSITDPLYQISREVIELVKTSPKSTMKFNRFIPAYHNHFGKQCRVADYGYTKLIELFEALSSVVQIMGDGENRQITLTHRSQIRRFTSDLLRVLRAHGNNSVLLSQLPNIFAQTQNRNFDVTDYGVCDIVDILDGLVNSNIVVVSSVQNGKDLLISIPKRKQTNTEVEKTCIFAGEMVELFRNALQYTILFQKFVRSYHYHFAYQCRLSDYGFVKLADLMDAIHGVVEMEQTNDEDKKIYLSPIVARRVFAEQCEELIRNMSGSSMTCIKLDQVLKLHKKKYGYQILPQTLGVKEINEAIELLPYVELTVKDDNTWITCHNNDAVFRTQCYRACKHLLSRETTAAAGSKAEELGSETVASKKTTTSASRISSLTMSEFISEYNAKNKNHLTEPCLKAMKHAIEIYKGEDSKQYVRISTFMKFLISIVRLLEQRTPMFVHELKSALDCSIPSTFEFGYPNLYTIVAAYPDLFALNVGATQERSDVALTPNCELRQSSGTGQQSQYGSSLKPTYGKQKSTRTSRAPLVENSNRMSVATQPPPHKTRALSNASDFAVTSNTIGNAGTVYKQQQQQQQQQHNNSLNGSHMATNGVHHYNQVYQTPQNQLLASQKPQQMNTKPSPPFVCTATTTRQQQSINSSIYSTASQHSSMLNTSASNLSLSNSSGSGSSGLGSSSNKENSLNSSMHFFNSSFNSSNTSFDLNNSSMTSMCGVGVTLSSGGMPSTIGSNFTGRQHSNLQSNKLWDRRQASSLYYQQQQQHQQQQHQQQHQPQQQSTMLGSTLTGLMMPQSLTIPPQLGNGGTSTMTDSTGLYDLVSNLPTNMCPIYEPPKPDTPPSQNMPFWIDPIWTNNSNAPLTNKNLFPNIRLPELKSLNVLPMLLSPYTLSKNENLKKQVFNFDNHDRKIA